jgi:hypothetical protein
MTYEEPLVYHYRSQHELQQNPFAQRAALAGGEQSFQDKDLSVTGSSKYEQKHTTY